MSRPVTVLIADDQALVRTGFKLLIDVEDDLEVVGEAADGAEAVALAREHRPDVVLMDIRSYVRASDRHLCPSLWAADPGDSVAGPPKIRVLGCHSGDARGMSTLMRIHVAA